MGGGKLPLKIVRLGFGWRDGGSRKYVCSYIFDKRGKKVENKPIPTQFSIMK
jgi:hypothetical protein